MMMNGRTKVLRVEKKEGKIRKEDGWMDGWLNERYQLH